MAEQITTMVANVDLQCSKCYRKVKKVLCKFSEIRDQVYDLKQNTVTIKVVCCNPEKIRQKICCKGGKSIKTIEIKPPEQKIKGNVETKTDTKQEKVPEGKTKPPPKSSPTKTIPVPAVLGCPLVTLYPIPFGVCCRECSQGQSGGPCQQLGYGRPSCYECYCYGRPVYDCWCGDAGTGGCTIL